MEYWQTWNLSVIGKINITVRKKLAEYGTKKCNRKKIFVLKINIRKIRTSSNISGHWYDSSCLE